MRVSFVRLAVLLAAFACIAPVQAQAQSIMIGLKGGVNVADVSITDETDLDAVSESITGLVGGAFVQFGGGGLGLRVEGLLSQRGFGDETGAELNADYIEIPVLLVARLSQSPVRPLLFAGPVASFETGCEISGEVGQVSATVDCLAADVETESAEFGVAFGAGLELDLAGLTLLFDGRYNLGLSNLDASGETDAMNRTFSFMGGLGFGIG